MQGCGVAGIAASNGIAGSLGLRSPWDCGVAGMRGRFDFKHSSDALQILVVKGAEFHYFHSIVMFIS